MSDETTTQITPPAPPADDRQVLVEELKLERTSLLAKVRESEAQMAAVLRERDLFKENMSKLEGKAKLADELTLKVEGLVNQGRESNLLAKIARALPGADPLTIKGSLIALSEQGRVSRYPEDVDAESTKILEILKSEAPGLGRPAIVASGSAGSRPVEAAKPAYRGPFSQH